MRHQKVRANAKATTIKTCSDSKMQIGWGENEGLGFGVPSAGQRDAGTLGPMDTSGLQDSLGPSTELSKKIVSSGIRTRKIKVKCNSNLFAQLLNAAIAVAAVAVAAVVDVAVGTRRIVCFVASCCTFL